LLGDQGNDAMAPTATELYEMIREAAYYRAEKRGFAPGLEAEDWAQAESEVIERVRRANGSDSAAASDAAIRLPK
jgi:hypothetical protein